MFSYASSEDRIPKSHPLRKLRFLVDTVLARREREFEAVSAKTGRPAVPPERLLKAIQEVRGRGLPADFVAGCRKLGVTPHGARKKAGSAIDGRTTRHAGYQTSLKVCKRIEEAKMVGGLRKTHLSGQAKLAGQALLCFATYKLVRMSSLSGGWNAQYVYRANSVEAKVEQGRFDAMTPKIDRSGMDRGD